MRYPVPSRHLIESGTGVHVSSKVSPVALES